MPAGIQSLNDAVVDSIQSYHELNAPVADELDEEPSPLEFMRYVARNRPFVVRNGARDWKSCCNWSAEYLASVMGDQVVDLAITPFGNADAPTLNEDGELVFAKPCEVQIPFSQALRQIQAEGLNPGEKPDAGVRYAQTQNDNLRNEYELLFADVPKDIAFARIGLGRAPDAINFWLGTSRSVTALHKDNYENIYVQTLGQKHFVLLPPIEAPCVNEQELRSTTYIDSGGDFRLQKDEAPHVPFATWDPDQPERRPTPFSRLSRPMRITLDAGDMMYLPALWYHKVSQTNSTEGISCSVNYWFDMDFDGSFYSLSSHARAVGLLAHNS